MATDNSQFLSLFWDLASDDANKRLTAAGNVIEYIGRSEAAFRARNANADGEIAADTDYALKRLIRGLGSSRDSARHGFATCLGELLSMQSIPLKLAITLIEELTSIKGSMKPMEQRDLIFGKLFAYLAIIRSGRLRDEGDSQILTIVLQKLLQLHEKREWLREVGIEAILTFLGAIPVQAVVSTMLPMLHDKQLLSEHTLAEYSAWQLLLAMGLEKYALEHPAAREATLALLPIGPGEHIFCIDNLPLLLTALVNAAGRFPKMHRVWDYCLGEIFGLDAERLLPKRRLASLGKPQESLLQALMGLLDTHFLTASHERRSVALRIAVNAVRLSPVELIPLSLSKASIRQLVAIRTDKKKVLYALAGGMIQELVAAAGSNGQCRVALANCLVSNGGANFDTEVGVPAVRGLLEGLGHDVIVSHVRFLGGIIHMSAGLGGSSASSSAKKAGEKKKARKHGGGEDEKEDGGGGEDEEEGLGLGLGLGLGGEDEEEGERSEEQVAESAAVASIDALAALASNTKLSSRGQILPLIIAMLVRISCFGAGSTLPGASAESSVKKGKRSSSSSSSSGNSKNAAASNAAAPPPHSVMLDDDVIRAVQLVDCADAPYPAPVAKAATTKLLSILAAVGLLTPDQMAQVASREQGKKDGSDASKKDKKDGKDGAAEPTSKKAPGPTYLQQATAALSHIHSHRVALIKTSTSTNEADEEEEEEVPPTEVMRQVLRVIEQLSAATTPLREPLCCLLQQMIFQVFTPSSPEDEDVLEVGILKVRARSCIHKLLYT